MIDHYWEQAASAGISRISVGAILIRESRVLLLRRSERELFLPNIFEFPGGGVENSEDTLSALARELCEETGLILTSASFHDSFDYEVKSGARTRQFNFQVDAVGKTPQLNPTEHCSYAWLTVEDLASKEYAVTEPVRRSALAAIRHRHGDTEGF